MKRDLVNVTPLPSVPVEQSNNHLALEDDKDDYNEQSPTTVTMVRDSQNKTHDDITNAKSPQKNLQPALVPLHPCLNDRPTAK